VRSAADRRRGSARVLLLVALLLAFAAALAALLASGGGAPADEAREAARASHTTGRAESAAVADAPEDGERATAPIASTGTRRDAAAGAIRAASGHVRVVDAASADPIPGARVAPIERGRASPAARDAASHTDASGRARVPSIEGEVVALEVAAAGHVTAVLPVELVPDGATIELEAAGALVVHAPNVPDVEVRVLPGVRRDGARPGDAIAATGRDGSGRAFRFTELAPGPYSVAATGPGGWVGGEVGVVVSAGEVTTVAIEVDETATFAGEVVELDSGQPLRDVRVEILPRNPSILAPAQRASIPPAVTGASGRFAFEGVPLGPAQVFLSLPDGSQVHRAVVVRDGQQARLVTLRARGSAALSGRITGELMALAEATAWRVEARPLYGLQDAVREIADAPSARHSPAGAAVHAPVAPDGTFAFDGAPTGRPLVLFATAPGVDQVGYAHLGEALEIGRPRDGVVVGLLRGRALELIVTGADGAPMEAIEVAFWEQIGGRGAMGAYRPFASATGRYEIEAITGDVRRLCVRTDGHATQWLAVPPPGEPLRVRLRPSRDVEFVVVGPSGRPVADVEVVARTDVPEDSPGHARRLGRTDASGRITLDLDVRWSWTVGPGDDRAAGPSVTIAPEDRPDEAIVLRCVPDDGDAIARIRGRIVRPGRRAPIHDMRFHGLRGASLEVEGEAFEVLGVPPGRVEIVVRMGGYEPLLLPVDAIAAGETVDVGELVARPATRVEVSVRGARGAGLRRARVTLERLPAERGGRSDLPEQVRLVPVSGTPGQFVFDPVGRGTWRLRVTHPGKAPVARDVALDRRTVRLDVTMKDT